MAPVLGSEATAAPETTQGRGPAVLPRVLQRHNLTDQVSVPPLLVAWASRPTSLGLGVPV